MWFYLYLTGVYCTIPYTDTDDLHETEETFYKKEQ